MDRAKETESYPWDAVWEYILDDRNFEEPKQKKKNSWVVPRRKPKIEEPSDSDSAYETDEVHRQRAVESEERLAPADTVLTRKIDRPKRRFRWLRRRSQKKKQESMSSPVAGIPRESFGTKDHESHRGTSRATQAARNRSDDDSVLGSQSVTSTSSVFDLLKKWGQKKRHANKDEGSHHSDDDSLSDEVTVMESIFNTQETRTDFDVDDRKPRRRAKQKWRHSVRERRDPSEHVDAWEISSVHSSQSRQSRSSRRGRVDLKTPTVSDDISVASYLLATQGGYLVHVPATMPIEPRRACRRKSFQGSY